MGLDDDGTPTEVGLALARPPLENSLLPSPASSTQQYQGEHQVLPRRRYHLATPLRQSHTPNLNRYRLSAAQRRRLVSALPLLSRWCPGGSCHVPPWVDGVSCGISCRGQGCTAGGRRRERTTILRTANGLRRRGGLARVVWTHFAIGVGVYGWLQNDIFYYVDSS